MYTKLITAQQCVGLEIAEGMNSELNIKKLLGQASVAHTSNPSYLRS
jgi:hypothetical protein